VNVIGGTAGSPVPVSTALLLNLFTSRLFTFIALARYGALTSASAAAKRSTL
jgi:hypothetical protein